MARPFLTRLGGPAVALCMALSGAGFVPSARADQPAVLSSAATSLYRLPPGDASRIPVSEIRLEMDPLDAEVLFRKHPYDRSSFPVTVLDGDRRLTGEVSVKGSFTRNFLKKSLLLKLDKGQTFNGHRRVALNAMATDPLEMREWLTWDLIRRMGMVAPHVQFRRLHINGKYIGLYLDIEWMDAAMFERLGLGGKGAFYQPIDSTFCGDLYPASIANPSRCWEKITPADDDYAELTELVRSMDAALPERFDEWLDQHFDAASVIDWLVINTLTQNGDTYNKNYFLHRGPDGSWRVIPWDYDLAWGRVADPALPFPRMIYNNYFQYNYPPNLGADNLLKRKTFTNPALYARFLKRMGEVLRDSADETGPGGWYTPQRFQQRLADLAARIRPELKQAQYRAHGDADFDIHLDTLAFFVEWRHQYLKGQLLDPSPFGNSRWLPYTAYETQLQWTEEMMRTRRRFSFSTVATTRLDVPHARHALVDKLLGWPLAMVTRRDGPATALNLEVKREQPLAHTPPGIRPGQCLERSWQVWVEGEAPIVIDLQFDYLQESSTRHELGPEISAEDALRLWHHDGQTWRLVGSQVNALANYIAAQDLSLKPWIVHRFAACTGG